MKHLIFLAFLALCGCSGHSESNPPPPASQPGKPITVDDIRRGVIGHLEVPLGSVVEVKGKVVPNTTNEKQYVGEPFFLEVEQVNEKRLSHVARFRGSDLQNSFRGLGQELPHVKIGDAFDFFAYETGGYGGIPFEAFSYGMPTLPTNGFHFITHLVILPQNPAAH